MGPFAYTRSPMYLGITSGLLGAAMLSGSLINLLLPVLFMLIMARAFIPTEENNLHPEFGEQFAAYKQQCCN